MPKMFTFSKNTPLKLTCNYLLSFPIGILNGSLDSSVPTPILVFLSYSHLIKSYSAAELKHPGVIPSLSTHIQRHQADLQARSSKDILTSSVSPDGNMAMASAKVTQHHPGPGPFLSLGLLKNKQTKCSLKCYTCFHCLVSYIQLYLGSNPLLSTLTIISCSCLCFIMNTIRDKNHLIFTEI